MIHRVGSFLKKLYQKSPVIAFDFVAIPLAWFMAYFLRFNMEATAIDINYQVFFQALLILSPVQMAVYYHYKVYRGLWRFCSLNDLMRILKSVCIASLLSIPCFYLFSVIQQIPRSVPILYAIIYTTLLCGARLLKRRRWDHYRQSDDENKPGVLIVGAGAAGEWLLRDMIRTKTFLPAAIVDDNPGKQGLEIHGVRVAGKIKDISDLVAKYAIDMILIAIPSAGSAVMRRIVAECDKAAVPYRTLPSIADMVSGKVSIQSFRQVKLEDLLGRDQVVLAWDKIAAGIAGKKVLVTGGGGSIGSELCRQIIKLEPAELQIMDSSEYNLYQIEMELKQLMPDSPLYIHLASVTDEAAVNTILANNRPDIVFHSAAYKHVPMLEDQVRTAVYNNVVGTEILAQACVGVGVEKFILISSDKAVNPSNIMGTTKRVAEIYCQNLNARVDTQFITVRFGNVLGSAGSVIPLFQKQLEAGGPLTVTHPEIERYFMTIPEACQLILQAMANGSGGEIFVLDMGNPIKIKYLAEQMISLSGNIPYQDIQIEFTGLRPGEKLYEELFHQSENLSQTDHEKLFSANYLPVDWQVLNQHIRQMHVACRAYQETELLQLLRALVPEFQTVNCSSASSTSLTVSI